MKGTPKVVPAIKWADGSDFVATLIPLKSAIPVMPGNDYQVSYTTRELMDGGKYLNAFALTEGGALVGGLSAGSGRDYLAGVAVVSSDQVGLFENGKFSAFSEPKSPSKNDREHTIIAGSVAEGHAVWSESLAEDPPHDDVSMGEWRIASANLATGLSRNLALSKGETPGYLGERRLSGDGSPRPVIAGKKVYWPAETLTAHAEDDSIPVLSVPLDGSQAMKLERNYAQSLARFEGGIVVAERRTSMDREGSPLQLTRAIHNKDDKQLLRIADGLEDHHSFSSFDADGTVVSFTYLDDFYIVDTKTQTSIVSKIPAENRVFGVTHCGARVSWTFQNIDANKPSGSRYVYDTETAGLRMISDPALTGPARCAGDYLSWSVSEGKGETFKTWDVVTRWEK